MCSVLGGQKRALFSLELELQKVLSHHVGTGNLILVFVEEQVLVASVPPLQLSVSSFKNLLFKKKPYYFDKYDSFLWYLKVVFNFTHLKYS